MSPRTFLAVAALCLLLAACGSARRGAPLQPPIELADSTLVQGEQAFMRYCNGCHPQGRAGVGLAINNKPLPAFLIRFQIRHGLGVMPAFPDEVISDADVRAIARYLVRVRHWD